MLNWLKIQYLTFITLHFYTIVLHKYITFEKTLEYEYSINLYTFYINY